MTVQYLIGDVFDKMAELEDNSVDLVLTSPPFLALRSYLPADHPDKDKEIGSEATPAEFVDTLLRLTAEWRRILTPHGSIAVELGDTFSGSGGSGGDYAENGLRECQALFEGSAQQARTAVRDKYASSDKRPGWPLAKSLALVPEAYRFALAYGHNPHTGEESPAGQWRVRNVVRWVRPNPPVGALGDKFRPATSEMVVACVSKSRWFDLDAVRTEHQTDPADYRGNGYTKGHPEGLPGHESMPGNPAGAPPLDWWKISPKGYAGAHYAVWPAELCVKPIQSMCPREVCRECGQPRRRIVERAQPARAEARAQARAQAAANGSGLNYKTDSAPGEITAEWWSDCGHNDFRPGVVLDPFAGTGTTLAVAHGHGRDAVGIDIDSRNAGLALERVGPMFLEVS